MCLQVYYWREHKHNSHHMEKHILNFSGNHTRGMLPGLHPFSLYAFNVRVYNGKGEGPHSPTRQFETPEGGEDKEGLCLSAPLVFTIKTLKSCDLTRRLDLSDFNAEIPLIHLAILQ